MIYMFTEVEAIVNHRPLTKVSDDVADDSLLSPAHRLMIRCSSQDWIGNFSQGDMYRRRWRYVQYLSDVSGDVISTNTCRNNKN